MKVAKSYGDKGDVVINLSPSDPKDINFEGPVFIYFDGLPVPFFIESYQAKGGRWIVKFENIDTFEEAEEIVGKEIFVTLDEDQDDELSIIGMEVYDGDNALIGVITDYTNAAGNEYIAVIHNGEEVLLPLHDDLIIEWGEEHITLKIPEGLL
ncbi:MAG TPA: PRC-barrel domain-containing protein [Bacteroidales bacterium]|nr:PRC-barrel domain-containing protein [Bacteroidales bacterium]HPK29891.1 PRC-barrel domain-containing protein [Bacteroidales bacterium]